ncbi:MAG: DUF4870 domain-containing protein [Planctomycetes bacterium]|nr:DUF4870 domain-containing protein [Planctomycetota bacterium]
MSGLVVAAPIWGALWIFDVVVTVLAAIRAHDGVRWRYPLTLRLL